jgi:molecular chaperone GrpE
MIYKQYKDLLMKQGVKPIEIKEKKFDPHLHQAFMTEESEDVEEPEVAEELQKGYTLHNRLLRPALVKVVVPKKG